MSGGVFGPGAAGQRARRHDDYHAALPTGSDGHVVGAVRPAAE
jgi:hypothetical protein